MMTETHGIVLDFSHGSATDLDLAVVWYAKRLGWDGGQTDINLLLDDYDFYINGFYAKLPDGYTDEEDFHISYQEALTFACDDAVEWLNEAVAETGYYFTIDDNSLYYWRIDEDF